MTGTGLLYDQDATSTFTWKLMMNVPSVPNGERGTGFEPACTYLEGRWVAVTLPARLCYLRLGTGIWIPRAGAQTKMNNAAMPNPAIAHSMAFNSPSIVSP